MDHPQKIRNKTSFSKKCGFVLMVFLPIFLMLSMGMGRYEIPIKHVFGILLSQLSLPLDVWWSPIEERLIINGRLPRVLLAATIGAGLSGAGASLQNLFRNPLADPSLIGISAGAACGGVCAILFNGNHFSIVSLAFIGGLSALLFVRWLASYGGKESVLTLILAGIVISAVFSAFVSFAQLFADARYQLPSIVFWLMGSMASADYTRLVIAAIAVGIGLILLWMIRFQLYSISLGEDDAKAMGLATHRVRGVALFAVALIVAASVAVCGVIGWVGLVIPHLARMLGGSHYSLFIPLSAIIGAFYLVIVDTFARSATDLEIPLGALTALLGAPLFVYLLRRMQRLGG